MVALLGTVATVMALVSVEALGALLALVALMAVAAVMAVAALAAVSTLAVTRVPSPHWRVEERCWAAAVASTLLTWGCLGLLGAVPLAHCRGSQLGLSGGQPPPEQAHTAQSLVRAARQGRHDARAPGRHLLCGS